MCGSHEKEWNFDALLKERVHISNSRVYSMHSVADAGVGVAAEGGVGTRDLGHRSKLSNLGMADKERQRRSQVKR